jgi:hypothetical protein
MVRFKAKIRVVLKRDANEIRYWILRLLRQLAFPFRLCQRTCAQGTRQYAGHHHHNNRVPGFMPFDLKSHSSFLSLNLSKELKF